MHAGHPPSGDGHPETLNREKHHQSQPKGALARLIREERKRRHPVEHTPF